ncbi:hypothetical protein V2J09_005329 [Rumex salicifolius]
MRSCSTESMMSNSTAGQLVVAAECTEQTNLLLPEPNINMAPPSFHMPRVMTPQESVAILWDIENCPVPSDVRPEDVAGNIRMALRVHPVIRGAITMFSAYGDFNAFPRRVREGCQRTGVKLVDVPNGRKDAADKAILVDMFLFALDYRPPSFIMLISGDVDFAPALHILGQRGYTVILVIPSGVGVSSALSNAGRFVWDWQSVARGEGFVPSTRSSRMELSAYADGQEEEAIVYRGISESYYNSRDFSVVSRSLSEYTTGNLLPLPSYTGSSRTQSLPPGTNDTFTDQNEPTLWVQPGDINGLKGQLVKLLEISGGCMTLTRIPAEYQKCFGRPLYMSEYGASKLIVLLKRMSDVISVDGRGPKKFVYLRNTQMDPNAHGLVSSRKDKGKGVQEDIVGGSSDELSDEERVVLEERNDKAGSRTGFGSQPITILKREDRGLELERFKYELMEILVSYSCRIFVSCFEEIYQQRYKKPLDCQRLGANNLDELFGKMRDVVVLCEDPGSKMKFLAAVGM